MTRFLLPIILISLLPLVGCDSPRSLRTAQMTPAILPVSQAGQAEVAPASLEMAEGDTTSRPATASVAAGRR